MTEVSETVHGTTFGAAESSLVGCTVAVPPKAFEHLDYLLLCHGDEPSDARALVYLDGPRMHLRDALITVPSMLTWRGFLGYKLPILWRHAKRRTRIFRARGSGQ